MFVPAFNFNALKKYTPVVVPFIPETLNPDGIYAVEFVSLAEMYISLPLTKNYTFEPDGLKFTPADTFTAVPLPLNL